MKSIKFILTIFTILVVMVTSGCDPNFPNPNGPAVPSATVAGLAQGLESYMRTDVNFYYAGLNGSGRETYMVTSSDPLWTSYYTAGQVSQGGATAYVTRTWNANYKVYQTGKLLESTSKTELGLTTAQQNAAQGYAMTLEAYVLLRLLNNWWTNGIKVGYSGDVNIDGNRLSHPFVSVQQGFKTIDSLLDAGYTKLVAGGSAFPFSLSTGFAGFNTPSTFGQFNQALKARVSAYQAAIIQRGLTYPSPNVDPNNTVTKYPTGAIGGAPLTTRSIADVMTAFQTALGNSFVPNANAATLTTADLIIGPAHYFKAEPGNGITMTNLSIKEATWWAHTSLTNKTNGISGFVGDSTATVDLQHGIIHQFKGGTKRTAAKIFNKETTKASLGSPVDINANNLVGIYPEQTTPITIINKEELYLLWAELYYQQGVQNSDNQANYTAALAILNKIRAAYGEVLINTTTTNSELLNSFGSSGGVIPPSPAIASSDVLDLILKERKFSLMFLGHRWIDMRRFGLINELEKVMKSHDRSTDKQVSAFGPLTGDLPY